MNREIICGRCLKSKKRKIPAIAKIVITNFRDESFVVYCCEKHTTSLARVWAKSSHIFTSISLSIVKLNPGVKE